MSRKRSVLHHLCRSRTAARSHVLSFVRSARRHIASADVPHGIDVVLAHRQSESSALVCFALPRVLEVGGTLRYVRIARLWPNVVRVGRIL
jgi:hypothetical protein